MNFGRTVFAQLIEHLSHNEFQKCVARYGGDRYAKEYLLLEPVSGDGFRPTHLSRKQSLYALDSTTIDLCLRLFPWARFSLQTTP
jgi:hypothetical protein